jgi:myo-inositol-1(or 4)-monophosphatase
MTTLSNTHEVQKILANVIDLTKTAGSQLRALFTQPHTTDLKSTDVDLVTEADKQIEAFMVGELTKHYPAFGIVGEEGNTHTATDSPYHWYIDPIDGTTNFAHGIPHFAICAALFDQNQFPPLLGIVYDPMRDECFAGLRGHGATLNSQTMRVSRTPHLSQAVVASGFPYTKWVSSDNNVAHWGDFVVRVRGIRRMGSAGLDGAYVAAGRFDGYWEHSLSAWDISASLLFVTEAGGYFSHFDGGPVPYQAKGLRVVASNGLIHEEMIRVLQEGSNAPRP